MRSTFRLPLLVALVLLAIAAAGFATPQRAAAHPLGNFSINSYCRIEPSAQGLSLRYVLDMAEIPTFQELVARKLDSGTPTAAQLDELAASIAERLADNLVVDADGQQLPLAVQSSRAELRPGQGGLQTLYLVADLSAPLPTGAGPWSIDYSDHLYGVRPGWREVVVRAADGMRILESNAPADELSNELTAYPDDQLQAPLVIDGASFTFARGAAAASAAPVAPVAPALVESDVLTMLATTPVTGPLSLATALVAALLLGAGHALTPGHGKTIVAAYLVGTRGTVGHALFLGVTTTVTHTAGVFALGLLTLFVSEWVLPERLYPWLGAVSGALVMLIGLTLLRQRLAALFRQPTTAAHQHHDVDEHGGHDHGTGYHTHAPPPASVSWRGLLALGVSGGLLPCPSALVVLLGAVALGRPALGLLLVVSFSLGLASILTGIGVVLVRARSLFARLPAGGRLLPSLSLAGAAVVTVAGVVITVQALSQTGLLG